MTSHIEVTPVWNNTAKGKASVLFAKYEYSANEAMAETMRVHGANCILTEDSDGKNIIPVLETYDQIKSLIATAERSSERLEIAKCAMQGLIGGLVSVEMVRLLDDTAKEFETTAQKYIAFIAFKYADALLSQAQENAG